MRQLTENRRHGPYAADDEWPARPHACRAVACGRIRPGDAVSVQCWRASILGKSPQPTASDRPGREPHESDSLEQTVSLDGPVPGPRETYGLDPVPIPAAWILDGDPIARERSLARSSDSAASAHLWDCTSGRFQWEYAAEEIVHVLKGCAIVEIAGVSKRLQPGDTHVFPAGSRFRWTVPDYVRTVTFRLHSTASGLLGRRLQAALGSPWRTRRNRSS